MGDTTTSNTSKETRLPESITIGETTFIVKDTPELVALISKISQIEKSKLYSQIEVLKEGLAKLENMKVEPNDLGGLKDELMAAMTSEIQKALQPLIDKTEKIESNSIEDYKKKLISDNADSCIPEMVQGDTKEALDASLLASKEVRKRIAPPQNTNTNAGATTAPQNTVNNNVAPVNSNQRTQPQVPTIPVEEPSKTDIAKLSPKEFAARREELKQQISTLAY